MIFGSFTQALHGIIIMIGVTYTFKYGGISGENTIKKVFN